MKSSITYANFFGANEKSFVINWPLEWRVNELFIHTHTHTQLHHTIRYLIRLRTTYWIKPISRKNSKQNFLTCSVFTSFLQKMSCLHHAFWQKTTALSFWLFSDWCNTSENSQIYIKFAVFTYKNRFQWQRRLPIIWTFYLHQSVYL